MKKLTFIVLLVSSGLFANRLEVVSVGAFEMDRRFTPAALDASTILSSYSKGVRILRWHNENSHFETISEKDFGVRPTYRATRATISQEIDFYLMGTDDHKLLGVYRKGASSFTFDEMLHTGQETQPAYLGSDFEPRYMIWDSKWLSFLSPRYCSSFCDFVERPEGFKYYHLSSDPTLLGEILSDEPMFFVMGNERGLLSFGSWGPGYDVKLIEELQLEGAITISPIVLSKEKILVLTATGMVYVIRWSPDKGAEIEFSRSLGQPIRAARRIYDRLFAVGTAAGVSMLRWVPNFDAFKVVDSISTELPIKGIDSIKDLDVMAVTDEKNLYYLLWDDLENSIQLKSQVRIGEGATVCGNKTPVFVNPDLIVFNGGGDPSGRVDLCRLEVVSYQP